MSLKSLAEKVREWQRYRESIRELSRLSNRELNDLGISRADIAHVAKNGLAKNGFAEHGVESV